VRNSRAVVPLTDVDLRIASTPTRANSPDSERKSVRSRHDWSKHSEAGARLRVRRGDCAGGRSASMQRSPPAIGEVRANRNPPRSGRRNQQMLLRSTYEPPSHNQAESSSAAEIHSRRRRCRAVRIRQRRSDSTGMHMLRRRRQCSEPSFRRGAALCGGQWTSFAACSRSIQQCRRHQRGNRSRPVSYFGTVSTAGINSFFVRASPPLANFVRADTAVWQRARHLPALQRFLTRDER